MPYMKNAQSLLKQWVESSIWFGCTDLTIGSILSIRNRSTVAVINAGFTLLPALPGFGYRLFDAFAIAIGGAVATVTTVDILRTVSTSKKLVAFTQASLTRSTIVRAGASGGTILADGDSFVRNDVNTAITVGITGASIATATHIDFCVQYIIEPEALT